MNIVAVFLGIIIVILIYILYTYMSQAPIDINSLVYLKTDSPTIGTDRIKNHTSAKFSYALWIYVQSWDNHSKPLLNKGNQFKLYLDSSNSTLKVDIVNSSNTDSVTLMSNFPIQRWCYVIISIDNKIMDFYFDGKLVLSKQLTGLPSLSDSAISIGGDTNPDIYLAKISRWPSTVNPQTAWDTYMQGNGQTNALNNQYNVKLSVLKDNIETKRFSLF